MSIRLIVLAFCLLLPLASAKAHGPTPKKIEEDITIDASPDKVWAAVKELCAMSAWHPLIAKCDGNGTNVPGAERVLTLAGGGQIRESIDEYDEAAHSYGYRLAKEDVQVFPVSFYSATFEVKDAGGGKTAVAWMGRFYRGDTGNFPPDNLNDEAAEAAMTKFFREGLAGLKKKVESQ